MGPGDSVTAFIDDRIWLWNEPIHEADFFMPGVTSVVTRTDVSSFILMTTWLGVGVVSSNFVHAKSRDDWSVAILSGFTVISSHTYLNAIKKGQMHTLLHNSIRNLFLFFQFPTELVK